MLAKNKRNRTSNFTADKKDILFNIVYNHKHVVENKQTDAVTCREKENAWENIAEEYNSLTSMPRPMELLRKCYMNKKKQKRQDISNECIQLLQMGGGPPEMPIDDPHKELLLKIMNKKTIAGLDNPFDMDNVQPSCNENDDIQSPGNPVSESNSYVREIEMLSRGDIDNIEVITEDGLIAVNLEENQERIINWGDCKSSHLKTLVTNKLKKTCNNASSNCWDSEAQTNYKRPYYKCDFGRIYGIGKSQKRKCRTSKANFRSRA